MATRFSAFSRGTERLVALGRVPESEWSRMRAPMQVGSFPFPVKYGYSAAGEIVAGPQELLGQTGFCLHPHQDQFQVASTQIVPCGQIPARRATLAANMETALNAHWDAGTAAGDRIAVVGAGVVGLLVAYLGARIAGTRVTVIDVEPSRRTIVEALGGSIASPDDITDDHRLVFHTSATEQGLATAIAAAALEGKVVELSWYGDRAINLGLGGAFHARRLQIISSQVGHVAPSHRATVTHHQRLSRAVALLDDPALDALVQNEVNFEDVPEQLATILSADSAALPPVIRYPT